MDVPDIFLSKFLFPHVRSVVHRILLHVDVHFCFYFLHSEVEMQMSIISNHIFFNGMKRENNCPSVTKSAPILFNGCKSKKLQLKVCLLTSNKYVNGSTLLLQTLLKPSAKLISWKYLSEPELSFRTQFSSSMFKLGWGGVTRISTYCLRLKWFWDYGQIMNRNLKHPHVICTTDEILSWIDE